MAELLPCECGKIPQIIIKRNPYEPTGCFVGSVECECGKRIGDYGLSTENKEFLTNLWNANAHQKKEVGRSDRR